MNNNAKNFDEKLDIDPLPPVEIEYKKPVFNENVLDDATQDYKFLRDKMRFLMANGEYILDKSLNALNSDPTPRAIEAASLILRNVVDISDKLMQIHEKNKKISIKSPDEKITDPDDKNKVKTTLVELIKEMESLENKKEPDK